MKAREKSPMIDVGYKNTKEGYLNKTDESRKPPKRGNPETKFSFPWNVHVFVASPPVIFQGSAEGLELKDKMILVTLSSMQKDFFIIRNRL